MVKNMAEIGVGIVGCGYVATSHLAAWRRIPFANVIAVCDSNVKAVNRFSRDWKIPKMFTSTSQMSDSKEISLWDICTPINTHRDLANQGMTDGFDVLIEKPLTINVKHAKDIVDCQRATGRKAGVIHNWLFEPPVLRARDIVERGALGEIIGAQINVLHTKDDMMTANRNHWSHQLPGGRFSEMLIHPIYLLRHFLGNINIESVSTSKLGRYPWMKYDELTMISKADQKLAQTYVSFNAPRNSITINLFGRKAILRVDIITATLNILPNLRMRRTSKVMDSTRQATQFLGSILRNTMQVISGRWFDGHEMCIRKFAESIIEEKEPPVTVQEGYEVVKVLESAYKRIGSE